MKENEIFNESDNILKIIDLNVEYRTLEGKVYALNGLNLDVKHGEAIGLVGETGAGKTTTALSVLNLLPRQGVITRGQILFEGKSLINVGKKDIRKIRGNDISMIFQDPMSSLNPVYTVKHQIAETVKVHQNVSWNEAYERSIEMLRAVGISEDRADDYPHEFSGGMIQRVMIAIALSCQPKLLIADEPTTALDVTIQAQVMDLIKRLRKDFKTSMIIITHDLGIIPDICEKIFVLYAGKVIEQGSIKHIYKKAMHPYTKGLFNCVPDIDYPDKQLEPILGLPPSSRKLFTGCAFFNRCKHHKEICNKSVPELIEVDKGHKVACFLFNKN